ncbi:MAG: DUF1428 domain-containing protein [Gammaproteobacteria bacterium]|nr:DUF1428 domain-containing protein [Gammaproteobacteria bacterium]
MNYVDGFVVPVPKDRLDEYRKVAEDAGKVWLEYGALQFVETVADDVPDGVVTSFPMAVKLEPGEVVVFSWIIYESRAERDRINAKVMADPRISGMDDKTMPFDGQRMIWGGFSEIARFELA